MREYTIRSGSRDDLPRMPAAPIDVPLWGGSFGISAQAQLCYDSDALYVRLRAAEEHIRAENTEVWQEPCEDSCLEFFFSPVPGDRRYLNVEFNLKGCMYLGLGSCMDDLVRLVPDKGDPFAFRAQTTPDGWEITYAVPHDFVRRFFPAYAPRAGMVIRGNFYKCGDKTAHPHYLAWNPIRTEAPLFHVPDDFGTLRFA
ncbi:MAG: hypothetical protein J5482_01120 [Oscillospiraceae bacterium]|nr:hypothetical protein [Oscillospiraceae bacterium]